MSDCGPISARLQHDLPIVAPRGHQQILVAECRAIQFATRQVMVNSETGEGGFSVVGFQGQVMEDHDLRAVNTRKLTELAEAIVVIFKFA
jgi:hypothetical protein